MKRSEINQAIREAEAMFAAHCFLLPKFASWSPAEWAKHGEEIQEIYDCCLGWDVTDFGRGDYTKEGLMLFTVRNGVLNSGLYPKGYAEKIMISHDHQVTPMHCHEKKREDIINRGGGNLVFELYNRKGTEVALDDTPVKIVRDGEVLTIPAGQKLVLSPGESITLTPNLFHLFYGDGTVMVGEVSSVNDDHTDNVFLEPQKRFPSIIEDEEPYRLIVGDYEHRRRV